MNIYSADTTTTIDTIQRMLTIVCRYNALLKVFRFLWLYFLQKNGTDVFCLQNVGSMLWKYLEAIWSWKLFNFRSTLSYPVCKQHVCAQRFAQSCCIAQYTCTESKGHKRFHDCMTLFVFRKWQRSVLFKKWQFNFLKILRHMIMKMFRLFNPRTGVRIYRAQWCNILWLCLRFRDQAPRRTFEAKNFSCSSVTILFQTMNRLLLKRSWQFHVLKK